MLFLIQALRAIRLKGKRKLSVKPNLKRTQPLKLLSEGKKSEQIKLDNKKSVIK